MIFGCFNNVIPANVKYAIKASSITTLDEAMENAYEMEENMLKKNVDLELILGKVLRKMKNLSLDHHRAPISRNEEGLGTRRSLFF